MYNILTDYIAGTANAIGEWAGATTAEAEHKTKAEGHREVRDQEWNKATNSSQKEQKVLARLLNMK